MTKLETHW